VVVQHAVKTCEHLERIEWVLVSFGLSLGDGKPCPHDDEWGTWYSVPCTFDEKSLQLKLELEPCVRYEEYEGRFVPSDAMFYCTRCKKAIIGKHPRHAGKDVVRLT
jgi:hypothetical protein